MFEFPTSNTQPEKSREAVSQLMRATARNLYSLYFDFKVLHWNFRGQQFLEIHKQTEEFAEQILGLADECAERSIQLGYHFHGTVRTIAGLNQLAEMPMTKDGTKMLQSLARQIAQTAGFAKDATTGCQQHDDLGSQDIMIQVNQALDKMLWFIEAVSE